MNLPDPNPNPSPIQSTETFTRDGESWTREILDPRWYIEFYRHYLHQCDTRPEEDYPRYINRITPTSFFENQAQEIHFDPNVQPDLHIHREHAHDGTLLFHYQIVFHRILLPLIFRQTYKIGMEDKGRPAGYTLGHLTIEHCYKIVNLPAGNYPGEIETFDMPVKIHYSQPPTPWRNGELPSTQTTPMTPSEIQEATNTFFDLNPTVWTKPHHE